MKTMQAMGKREKASRRASERVSERDDRRERMTPNNKYEIAFAQRTGHALSFCIFFMPHAFDNERAEADKRNSHFVLAARAFNKQSLKTVIMAKRVLTPCVSIASHHAAELD